MDLISRQTAIDALRQQFKKSPTTAIRAMNTIEELPSAQPERKRGEWIKRDSYDRRDNFYTCSECGRVINIISNAHLEDYPFCHCGADMRGEQDE